MILLVETAELCYSAANHSLTFLQGLERYGLLTTVIRYDCLAVTRKFAISMTFLLLFSTLGNCRRFDDPRNALIRTLKGMSAAEFSDMLAKAQRGDPEAQLLVGVAYEVGCRTEKNSAEAADWFRKAAMRDNNLARIFLGDQYRNGTGVQKSALDALSWYKEAAKTGDAVAEAHIGTIYFFGEGVERNFINAAQWYVKAAKQGNTEAEINLAWLYHLGQGVPKNENIRASLYGDAAKRGEPLGYTNLGEMYRDGDGVKKDYVQAIEFLRKGADLGNSSAQNDLGEMYRDGKGVTRDPEASLSWFLKAAEQNNDRRAFENLFQYYRSTSPPDLVTAYQWAYVSAQNGSLEGEKFLKDGSKKLSKTDVGTAVSRASEWLNAHPRAPEGCTIYP